MRCGQAWDLLGEGVGWAGGVVAEEPADSQWISTCWPPMAASASVRGQRFMDLV
jgi:hypothetical protein